MKLFLFALFSISCILSCNDAQSSNGKVSVSNSSSKKEKKPVQQVEDWDEPMIGTHYPIKHFELKTYSKDELPEEDKKEKYVGLVKNKSFSWKPLAIKFKNVFDPQIDRDTLKDKSAIQASYDSKDTLIFITKSSKELPARGTLKKADISVKTIKPGDKIEFKYNGVNYQLSATGEKNKDKTILYPYINYKLYFTSQIDGKKIGQTIMEKSFYDDSLEQIIFAGDLDGDNKLDLVLNTSYYKDMSNPTLYLSKNAPTGSLLMVSGMKETKK